MKDDPRRRKAYWQGLDEGDGKINIGRNYKDQRKAERLRRQVAQGTCPHPWVMMTARCQTCGVVKVWIVKEMPEAVVE